MNHTELNKIFLSNWMTLLAPEIKAKRLRDLLIPGAHDANTHTIPIAKIGSEFARCQDVPVEEQAKLGVRFFDFRYGASGDPYAVLDCHGVFKGGDFFENFAQLRKFSDSHKDEFFIISLQAENKLGVKAKKRMIRKINGILFGKLIDKRDTENWFKLEKVTLAQIFESRKRFLVFAREELWEETGFTLGQLQKAGIHSQADCVVSKWHDVAQEEILLQRNIDELKMKESFPDKIFVSQFVLTIQRDPKSILGNLITMDMPTIVNFVEKLHQASRLPHFISMNLGRPFNVMLFDHVAYDRALMELIVSANNSEKIELHKFYVGELDLTEKFKSRVKDGRVFYVYSLGRVFEKCKPKFRQVCAIYSFGGGPFRIRVSSSNEKSMIIYSNVILKDKEEVIRGYILWIKNDAFKIQTINSVKTEKEIKEICKGKKQESVLYVTERLIYLYKFKVQSEK